MTNEVLTADEVARHLGISPGRVRKLAISRGLGRRLSSSHRATWIFTAEDIERMRERHPGQPRKGKLDKT